MAPENRAPFRWPPRGCKRGSSSRGGIFGSRPRRLCRSVTVLLVTGRLLLLAPTTEVGISPKHHLECGIDDVIGSARNERRVLLDGHRNRLLQFVFAFHHLWRFVDDRHGFSFPFSFSWPNSTRAKHMVNRAFPCSLGWSDRHGFRGNEVGSLQPSFVFCPCPKSIVESCTTSAFPTTSVHREGERNGEPQSEPRRSCAVHPVPVPFVEGQSPVPDAIVVKENCPFRCQL